ncbi:MAG: hypothetical protein K5873_04860 [Treponema sp.]|nr:hypothetical protein [Treponema sp.]
MKKSIFTVLTLSLSSSLFATTFFSGETGLAVTALNNDSRSFDPNLCIDGYLAGHFSFSNAFSIRGEFSLDSGDMWGDGLIAASESSFQINELSANFTKSMGGANHTFSLFLGYFESPGSQRFIRGHLGVENFSSPLTETFLGQKGNFVYANHGYGASYALTLKSIPLSAGLSVSKMNENFEGLAQINTDLRLALALQQFKIDLLAGIGAPLYTKNSNDEEVFLLIDTLYLHTGFDILFGNKYSFFSLFGQLGIDYIPIKSTSKSKTFEPGESYLLVEPRFNFEKSKIYITLYSIPEEKKEHMLYLSDTLGVNVQVIDLKSSYLNGGLNTSVSFEGKTFNSLEDKDLVDKMNLTLSPFMKLYPGKGELSLIAQIGLLRLINNNPKAIKIHLGYKKIL